jgi:hypothetical protein
LLPATKPVSNNNRIGGGLSHFRQKHALSNPHGDIMVLALVSEEARQTAAARVEHGRLDQRQSNSRSATCKIPDVDN